METMLFQAHSGVRYLVLLAAVAALVAAAIGWQRRGAEGGPAERPLTAAFVGLLDLQALLGIVLLLMWQFYGQLIGHIVMMVAAVAVAHIGSARAKKKTVAAEASKLRALTIGGALLLVVAGIMAIQRPLL